MKKCAVALMCLFAVLLTSCAVAQEKETAENSYLLYYPASQLRNVAGEDAIVTRSVIIEDADKMEIAQLAESLLLELVQEVPDDGVLAPMPSGTQLRSLAVAGRWARVDFSSQYARLAGIDLTLADYCVALTLIQLDGINAVSITANGRELPYRKAQLLTAADPLLSVAQDTLRPIAVTLYFLDPTTGELVAERQVLELYEGQTRANALLEALLRGPENDALRPLLSSRFSVLSARVEEGVCYLNLAEDAELCADEALSGLAAESLVRSLCSLGNIESVQIVVDGDIVPQLGGIDISAPLTPSE